MTDLVFSIHIVDEEGHPRNDANVFVSYSDFTHDADYTDEEGWVTFEKETTVQEIEAIAKLYVDDNEVDADVTLEDGSTLTYTVCCNDVVNDK